MEEFANPQITTGSEMTIPLEAISNIVSEFLNRFVTGK